MTRINEKMKNIEVEKNGSISTFEASINLFKSKKNSHSIKEDFVLPHLMTTRSLYFVMNKIFREPRIYNGTFPSRYISVS